MIMVVQRVSPTGGDHVVDLKVKVKDYAGDGLVEAPVEGLVLTLVATKTVSPV